MKSQNRSIINARGENQSPGERERESDSFDFEWEPKKRKEIGGMAWGAFPLKIQLTKTKGGSIFAPIIMASLSREAGGAMRHDDADAEMQHVKCSVGGWMLPCSHRDHSLTVSLSLCLSQRGAEAKFRSVFCSYCV